MKSVLARVLAMLAILGTAALAAGGPAAANNGTANPGSGKPPTAAKEIASFPAIGTPFVSGSFIGTVEIVQFRVQGNRIVADTLLRKTGKKATPATLPVKIAHSSCQVLELHVGPPAGGNYPLVITQHQGNSNLSASDFCGIASANGLKEQVAVLNDDSGGLTGLKSCSFLDALKCAGAMASCASSCIAGPEFCILCFASIGVPNCYDCF
ncbi:MAG: hypothetical protein AB7I59_12675 [Geminicoccaceae bacterium]